MNDREQEAAGQTHLQGWFGCEQDAWSLQGLSLRGSAGARHRESWPVRVTPFTSCWLSKRAAILKRFLSLGCRTVRFRRSFIPTALRSKCL